MDDAADAGGLKIARLFGGGTGKQGRTRRSIARGICRRGCWDGADGLALTKPRSAFRIHVGVQRWSHSLCTCVVASMKLRTCCTTTSTPSRCGTGATSMPSHRVVRTQSRVLVAAQGLAGRWCSCNWGRSESLKVFALNLPEPTGDLKRLRLPLTGLSSKNVSTNVLADVLGVVAWSFQCLAWTISVASTREGAPMDSKRAKIAGQTLGVQGVLAEVRGDWKFMKDTVGFPGWNTNSGICWLCDCTPQTLRDVGHDAPWRVNRRSHWDFLAYVARGGHAICTIFGAPWLRSIDLTKVWLRTSWAVSSFTSSRGPTCLERPDEDGASLSGSAFKVFTINVR